MQANGVVPQTKGCVTPDQRKFQKKKALPHITAEYRYRHR